MTFFCTFVCLLLFTLPTIGFLSLQVTDHSKHVIPSPSRPVFSGAKTNAELNHPVLGIRTPLTGFQREERTLLPASPRFSFNEAGLV